jgi:hypothetical protein
MTPVMVHRKRIRRLTRLYCIRLNLEDMAIKKSRLYAVLRQFGYELRGGMDAPQYKDYGLARLHGLEATGKAPYTLHFGNKDA